MYPLFPVEDFPNNAKKNFFYEMNALSAPNDFSVAYDDDTHRCLLSATI